MSDLIFDARVSADGRATLGPRSLGLRSDLDRRFAGWGVREAGAAETAYPTVLTVAELAPLDYFDNFPHLASVVTGLTEARQPVLPAAHALPSAACYSAYLDLAGSTMDGSVTVTTVAGCFRRERHYDGLRRLYGFSMREIVRIGPREAVLEFLAAFRDRVRSYLDAVGLPYELAAATDPFFDPSGARSLMQRLFPVKEEFVYGGSLAIASVNFHRNFFGERCGITLPDGSPAFTGCVAFGLERWLAALGEHFGGDADRAAAALAAADEEPS